MAGDARVATGLRQRDWRPGEFFGHAKLYFICATHGALYAPDTGVCVAGPCRGARLPSLAVRARNGDVFCHEE